MPIQIQISKVLHLPAEQKQTLRWLLDRSAKAALKLAGPDQKADLSIILCDDDQIRELNRSYRTIDAVTDVLSFPSGELDPETGRLYLGDILISLPRAESQAAAGGHPIEAELQLLAVHGVLHLCGRDHASPEEKDLMWAEQAQVLEQLGSPIRGPAEDLG